jgi:hypothetical protein
MALTEAETSPKTAGEPWTSAGSEESAGAAGVTGMESKLAEKEAALSETTERLDRMTGAVADLEARLAKAAASYRTLIAGVHPEIPEDLISGQSIEEIDTSVEKAKSLVTRVKKGLEAAATRSRVPPGAPPRTAPDLAGMSPREKIKYGIGGNR